MGNVKETIESGKAVLGIEFGSTRIKAVLIDEKHTPIAGGSHEWENRYENGVWTYSLDDIWGGLTDCYASLKADVKEKYGVTLKRLGAIGFSAMMHGYMVFDKDGQLLVPFRTWRNSITEEAADELTSLFNYNIPQRWSIAHLYQAMLNNEEHLPRIDYMTTLEGFIHWKLTGKRVIGVGEASGMFPIDTAAKNYNANMVDSTRSSRREMHRETRHSFHGDSWILCRRCFLRVMRQEFSQQRAQRSLIRMVTLRREYLCARLREMQEQE